MSSQSSNRVSSPQATPTMSTLSRTFSESSYTARMQRPTAAARLQDGDWFRLYSPSAIRENSYPRPKSQIPSLARSLSETSIAERIQRSSESSRKSPGGEENQQLNSPATIFQNSYPRPKSTGRASQAETSGNLAAENASEPRNKTDIDVAQSSRIRCTGNSRRRNRKDIGKLRQTSTSTASTLASSTSSRNNTKPKTTKPKSEVTYKGKQKEICGQSYVLGSCRSLNGREYEPPEVSFFGCNATITSGNNVCSNISRERDVKKVRQVVQKSLKKSKKILKSNLQRCLEDTIEADKRLGAYVIQASKCKAEKPREHSRENNQGHFTATTSASFRSRNESHEEESDSSSSDSKLFDEDESLLQASLLTWQNKLVNDDIRVRSDGIEVMPPQSSDYYLTNDSEGGQIYPEEPEDEQNLQQPTPEQNLQQPTPDQNLQQPTPYQNLQQPTPDQNLQQPTPNQNLPKQNLQQRAPNQNLYQPTPNQNLQQRTPNQNLHQPTPGVPNKVPSVIFATHGDEGLQDEFRSDSFQLVASDEDEETLMQARLQLFRGYNPNDAKVPKSRANERSVGDAENSGNVPFLSRNRKFESRHSSPLVMNLQAEIVDLRLQLEDARAEVEACRNLIGKFNLQEI